MTSEHPPVRPGLPGAFGATPSSARPPAPWALPEEPFRDDPEPTSAEITGRGEERPGLSGPVDEVTGDGEFGTSVGAVDPSGPVGGVAGRDRSGTLLGASGPSGSVDGAAGDGESGTFGGASGLSGPVDGAAGDGEFGTLGGASGPSGPVDGVAGSGEFGTLGGTSGSIGAVGDGTGPGGPGSPPRPDHSGSVGPEPEPSRASSIPVPKPPRTGDEAVDEALELVADAFGGELDLQLQAYESAHQTLQDRLADVES